MSDETEQAPTTERAAAREATNWAKAVSRLNVSEVPEGAVNINVEGRRLASPIQGFGRMWQKTYQVRLPSDGVSAIDLIATWKQRFPDFWPEGNRFYGPLTGIEPGEVALLNMSLPGKMKLSTGVMVLYADEESFTLMTPEGHMLAGWITFSATEVDGETVAQACAPATRSSSSGWHWAATSRRTSSGSTRSPRSRGISATRPSWTHRSCASTAGASGRAGATFGRAPPSDPPSTPQGHLHGR
ncbi:MAG: hypothetical protein M3401_17435 [Actinomycetota bacterium]|nr:hypothetical protein [Actinomycetota bacterium]